MRKGSGIHDFGFILFSRIVSMVIGLGTQVSLAWLLGTSDRGSFAVCLVFATFLNVFCLIGCDIASVYFVSSKRFTPSEGVVYAFIYGALGSALAIVAGWLLLHLPFSYWEKASIESFHLALFLVPTMVFSYTLLQLVTAVHRFGWAAFFAVLESLFILICTLVFLWWFRLGVSGALLGLMCGHILIVGSILFFFRRYYNLSWIYPKRSRLKEMFGYGIRYYFGKVSNLMNLEVGTIILAFFATRDQVGLFSVASQVTSHTMIIPTSLITVLIPKVASNESGRKELIAQCCRLTFQIMLVAMGILALIARPLVIILFSPEFAPAAVLIQIMTIGVVIRSLGKVLVPYMLGTNRPGISSLSVAVGAIVNLAALLICLPIWGLPGAAIAMVVGFFASTLILLVYFLKMANCHLRDLFVFKRSDWLLLFKFIQNAMKSFRQKFADKVRTI